MPHHPSATSEELSVEGPSAPPTTLHSHALGKQQVALFKQEIALLLQQANASSHGTLGKRALNKPSRFQEATPEKAIIKKGILDEPKAWNRGKSSKRASTGEETKPEKKGEQRKRPKSEALESPRAHAALGSQETKPKKKAKASKHVIVNRDDDYSRRMRSRVFAMPWCIESPEEGFGYMLKDLEVQMCFMQR